MNARDLKYFEIAKSLANLSTFNGEHLGAIIVLKKDIIAVGYNIKKTHPLQAYWANKANNPKAIYLHAELSCLSKLANNKHDLSLARIYVYRQNKQGELALAKPCKVCEMAIRTYGISQLYYTIDNGYCNEVLINK